MVKFGDFVSEKWNISVEVAAKICEHFAKGDSFYYLCDYAPSIAAEVDIMTLSDIYENLQEIVNLSPKKKRVINALTKVGDLTDDIKNRVELSTSTVELDDLFLPYRSKSRSKGQQAMKKNLGPFADIVDEQEIEDGSIEESAEEYVGTHASLKTVDDVIRGVKDILVERYADDETVRSMVRDVGFEDGFFEVFPKVKKDKRFLKYRSKMTPVNEFTAEEYLSLCEAEKNKEIRFKHGVQLFHINELMRHHFILNPDAIGYDCICEVIDECWTKSLHPMVERDVKARKLKESEDWALSEIDKELRSKIADKRVSSALLTTGMYDATNLVIVALDENGQLLSAAKEELTGNDKELISNRLKQFITRYKPSSILIEENDFAQTAEVIIKRSIQNVVPPIDIERSKVGEKNNKLANSAWMKERCAVLEDTMRVLYAMGISYVQPPSIISQVGVEHFTIHPLQKHVGSERFGKLLELRITEMELHKGVPFITASDSVLKNLGCVTNEALSNIRKNGAKKPFTSKMDLLNVDGMTELIFRNVIGYIIIPGAQNTVDRTLIHPEHYTWLNEVSQDLNASIDSLVNDPDRIRGLITEDFAEKVFINQKVPEQLKVGQQYPPQLKGGKLKRKHRLSELQEGSIITGRVTNITKFGVFVDINAVCDGLIHISQLADGYIETADQVVKSDDMVDVRILKVDKKKRRVSLSLKKLGSGVPKIRPSRGQLDNLADHFKNR